MFKRIKAWFAKRREAKQARLREKAVDHIFKTYGKHRPVVTNQSYDALTYKRTLERIFSALDVAERDGARVYERSFPTIGDDKKGVNGDF